MMIDRVKGLRNGLPHSNRVIGKTRDLFVCQAFFPLKYRNMTHHARFLDYII